MIVPELNVDTLITENQAETIEQTIDLLMRIDIALRSNLAEVIPCDDVTRVIIKLIESFSHTSERLEHNFIETGMRDIAYARRDALSQENSFIRDN